MRISGKALLGLLLRHKGAEVTVPLLPVAGWSLWCGGVGDGGSDWWVRLEGGLRWSAHPLGGAVCRDHVWGPALLPGPHKFVSYCS